MIHALNPALIHALPCMPPHDSCCEPCSDSRAPCCSPQLFAHLIPDESEAVWKSWCEHVEYLPLLTQKNITPLEVVALDKKIFDATETFVGVPQFKNLFKPKHHFAAHVSVNIERMGPLREYWCYSYEGFHQRVKHIARNSNWQIVSKRIARFFVYSSALRWAAGMSGSAQGYPTLREGLFF